MKYEVTVGNIGVVHFGDNRKEALKSFRHYRLQSLSGIGRAAHEPVTLWEDTEPALEFDTSPGNVVMSRDGNWIGYRNGYRRSCYNPEGCKGQRLGVIWAPGGKITYPCSHGLVDVAGISVIGPLMEGAEEKVKAWAALHHEP